MISFLGTAAIATALLSALAGLVYLLRGRAREEVDLVRRGHRAVAVLFVALTAAVALLEAALVGRDFSVRYVAANIDRATPLPFRIIGLWGALEGSILLWAWVQAGYAALVSIRYRSRHTGVPLAVAVMVGITSFFLLLMLGPANPFARIFPPPPDGRGLNPLLQNHPLMAVHPPFLYLGYVGFSVPYAFATAALLSRSMRDEWMAVTRRWTVAAWSFLSAGIVLGAWWSYEVLGWGGYWAWDPVENAALMPWLVATAFLHSVMVQERRRLLRLWNHTLVIVTFLLTLFGTFLTRSGILGSVHDFTQSLVGPIFLLFIGAVLMFSAGVLLLRRDELRDEGTLPAYLSRESLFLLNNVLLLVLAATVFIGTTFPLLAEAVAGVRLSVGPPYFNRLAFPLALALLVVMAVATPLPWGPVPRSALRRLALPGAVSLVCLLVLAGAGVRGAALGAFGVLAFAAAAQISEFHRGARELSLATGRPCLLALPALFVVNRRRYGGYLAHLGLALALAGVTASSAYRVESDHTVRRGDTFHAGSYLLRYDGAALLRRPDRLEVMAAISILPSGAMEASPGRPAAAVPAVVTLYPSERLYPQQRTPIPTPAVRSTWRGDLYLVLLAVGPEGVAVVKAMVNPLVSWIWTGGLLMALAGVISIWPKRRG
ncbi:MAG: cytochrome c-type biogenesis CcmF C-terminal domain-containing protein [Armatimonadota bacterium]|nr:cytochrome c-type biogenesis CcmF C-terminal domain-containing protein [Armatimonadota bacterium]MDR7464313.1 cytochrome c-type biogenesis CcmF C-terminal domain-containing protein [Armatimonadota bacterium]MDR7468923.1 cytochrome c-type biogenesis CcmF C-terminal domain-containing protein [Armatimonadota bacterium]MDR7475037.1 cytochrome c-type biogenesis CcmF C-terminal domain-containing protein [Armatimonadota bacterium]MDR7539524.1 cytochrome c-type biogenesis CcmF C-terminal domain-cont